MDKTREVIDMYNMCVGSIIAVLSYFLGPHWYLFAAYLLLNVFDWATGCYKARKTKNESSDAGLKGIIRKLGYWIIIAVAFLVSGVFVNIGNDILNIDLSSMSMIGWFTLACLLVNEVRSILENLLECGYNVPAILVKGLAVTEKLLNDKMEDNHE